MKTLYRSRNQKILAGVAGGIAEYFDIDPVFIRVLFVVSIFASGVGVLAYIILWIITPQEPFERVYKKKEYNTVENESEMKNSDPFINESDFDIKNEQKYTEENQETRTKLKFFGGILLIFLGLVILLDEIIPSFDFTYIWSILLILVGSYIIFSSPKKQVNNE